MPSAFNRFTGRLLDKSNDAVITDPNDLSHQAFVDHFHNLQTSEMVRLVGTKFVGTTKDTNFWTEVLVGTGTVAQAGGLVTLATGTTANSSASYTTTRIARFVPATTQVFRYLGTLSNTGTANNLRKWGIFDTDNGLWFELNGTAFNIVTRAGGVDTTIAQASWSEDNSFVLDTNIHSFEIRVSYRTADFYIDDVYVHDITLAGTAALAWQSLDLPAAFRNTNSAGQTANVSMSCILCTVFRLGKLETEASYKHITTAATTVCKYGAGRLHRITINNAGGTLCTVYDNTAGSGTVIAIINTPAQANPVTLEYGIPFGTGLTIVSTGTWDLTVIME